MCPVMTNPLVIVEVSSPPTEPGRFAGANSRTTAGSNRSGTGIPSAKLYKEVHLKVESKTTVSS